MTNKFVSIMEAIGRDVLKVFEEVVKYMPTAANLATLIFPGAAAPIQATVVSLDLIQKAVATVEQKFAATGNATGTGTQKLAQVLTIVTPTVTQLLASEGITADAAYITRIVNAVVAILNVANAPVTSANAPAPAALAA